MNSALQAAIAQRVGGNVPGRGNSPQPVGGLPFGVPGNGGLRLPVSMPNLGIGSPSSLPSDPRGIMGILNRGAPVYRGGLPNARTGGGPNIGRPSAPGGLPMEAVARRLGR